MNSYWLLFVIVAHNDPYETCLSWLGLKEKYLYLHFQFLPIKVRAKCDQSLIPTKIQKTWQQIIPYPHQNIENMTTNYSHRICWSTERIWRAIQRHVNTNTQSLVLTCLEITPPISQSRSMLKENLDLVEKVFWGETYLFLNSRSMLWTEVSFIICLAAEKLPLELATTPGRINAH